MNGWWGGYTLLLMLLFGLSGTVQAAREVEPNNLSGQATMVNPGQEIEGTIEDSIDFFKVILPEAGVVEVLVDSYPAGTRMRLGANGFSQSDDQLLAETVNEGRTQFKLKFSARERVGFIWLEVLFVDQVCHHEWCAVQLVKDGPWYTVKEGINPPPDWQGKQILLPPDYRMTIRQPGLIVASEEAERSRAQLPGYHRFLDQNSGLVFEHPQTWQVSAGTKPETWLVQPNQTDTHGMRIDLELVHRANTPGSSALLQLNLLERDLGNLGAEIRQRGELQVADSQAPYLVAILPADAATGKPDEMARMQVVVPFSDHYVRVGYFGPSKDYPEAIKIFENLLQTLGIEPQKTVEPAEK
jgi:hypothetical protein